MIDDDRPQPALSYVHERASNFAFRLAVSRQLRQEVCLGETRNAVILYVDGNVGNGAFMVNPKAMRWIEANIPIYHQDFNFDVNRGVFMFRHKHHAMLFKLSFADGLAT